MNDELMQPLESEDQQIIEITKLVRANEKLHLRVDELEKTVKELLMVMKRSEEMFELRATRVLGNIFGQVHHNLEHVIKDAQEELRLQEQGYDIRVVDGKDVKENENTILVRKREDGGYDYSSVLEPDVIKNENTNMVSAYFENNPTVFGDRKEILVNIKVLRSA